MSTSIGFDANNLAMRQLFGQDVLHYDKQNKNVVSYFDQELFRYRLFDALYKSLFKTNTPRELILAVDDKNSWRKLYWTKYKSHRKEKREALQFDWDMFYSVYDSFLEEIRIHTSIKVLRAKNAEADDIIGIIVLNNPDKNFHLVSTDKDYLQLCRNNVVIYNPLTKKVVTHPDPELFLVEQCLCGQAKDNIYNIKTSLEHPEGVRKPGFGEVAYEKVVAYGWERWLEENNLVERFKFNRNLIDFRCIPNTIVKRVKTSYENYEKCDPNMIYEFFKKHPWPEYLDNFNQVESKLLEIY